MERDDALIVIAAQGLQDRTIDLVQRLDIRCPTFWVDGTILQHQNLIDAGQKKKARYWVDVPPVAGVNTDMLPLLRASFVTRLVFGRAHERSLLDDMETFPDHTKPYIVSDVGVVSCAEEARRKQALSALLCERPETMKRACGVIVLPEDLHIIRSQHLWREREVVVVAGQFSTIYRHDRIVTAMARLLASYLEVGATRAVVSEEFFLRQPNPIRAYDDLLRQVREMSVARSA